MYVFIGIDPAATRLAAVVRHSGGFKIEKRTMPADAKSRCQAADRWIVRLVKENSSYGQVVVGIENPFIGGKGTIRGVIPLAQVHGALLAGAGRAGAIVVLIDNKSWKMTIVGNGNVNKSQVAIFVKKSWPKLYQQADGNQDVCDAACIVQHAEYVIKMRDKVAAGRRRHNKGK